MSCASGDLRLAGEPGHPEGGRPELEADFHATESQRDEGRRSGRPLCRGSGAARMRKDMEG
ncbi:MAG: hypothetical protein ACLTYN_11255 [Dysosmobacter welbionis]